MPYIPIKQPTVSLTLQFVQILNNEKFITNDPVRKKDVRERYKKLAHSVKQKVEFIEILQIMLYIKLVKRLKNKDPSFINFNVTKVNSILEKYEKGTNKNIQSNNLNKNTNSKPILQNHLDCASASNQTKEKVSKTRKQRREENREKNVKESKYLTKNKCILCSINFRNDEEYSKHINKIDHILRQKYRSNKKTLVSENMDIQIKIEKDETILTTIHSNINIKNAISCIITNNNNSIKYEVSEIILLYTQLPEIVLNFKVPILLKPQNSSVIPINFCFPYEGIYILPVVFKVVNKFKANEDPMYLLKEMIFKIKSNLDDGLEPTATEEKNINAAAATEDFQIIEGVKPVKSKSTSHGLNTKIPLKQYSLPLKMKKILNCGLKMNDNLTSEEQAILVQTRKLLSVPNRENCLTAKNYCHMLKTLLQFEEHQMQRDIRDFDCHNQTMRTLPAAPGQPKLLALNVPGLAENRPSLIKGDDLIVKLPGEPFQYKGFIHRVKETTVELGFFKRFVETIHHDSLLYSVSFGFNRHTLRTEHQAVDLVNKHNVANIFFPTQLPPTRLLSIIPFEWYQKDIQNNSEQMQAVKHIVARTSYPYPYLLFGPPGTGKTMTVVEAILQLWKRDSKSKILVAAPSNSAANEVTSRLVKYNIPRKDLFRMISVSFIFDQVPDRIKPYCNFENGDYYYPSIEKLQSYRILIVTLTAAAKLVTGGITEGHFSHVFVDESGHATESEVLIPIAGIITSNNKPGQLLGQVILAGDPEQLGPIIHSKLAKSFGFATSMLERLMKNYDVYKKKDNKYNPNMVTKLLKNFRSHPAILKLPDEMFYDNELIAEGNSLVDIALNWDELPNKKFPLIFHNVQGKDEQEANSPSFFNIKEINVVMNYLGKLIGQRLKGKKIEQSDIGIVSPYRKQAQKLQIACKKRNWYDILIGSVEQFQGQERLIIIISTVRSRPEHIQHDLRFHLGFLKNPKRFNVAITRAKALVIVVGNADILLWDKHWGQFIKYCFENKAVAGPKFQFKELWLNKNNAVNDLSEDFKKMSIEGEILENKFSNEHSDFSRGNL